MSKHRFTRPKFLLSLTHGAGATTFTSPAKSDNGLLYGALITTPAAVDGSATATINVLDVDGNIIYTKGSLAANTFTKDLLGAGLQVPLVGSYTVQVVFSAAQTATDTTTTVVLLLDRG